MNNHILPIGTPIEHTGVTGKTASYPYYVHEDNGDIQQCITIRLNIPVWADNKSMYIRFLVVNMGGLTVLDKKNA